jgi:hypothetical protein
MSSRAMFGGGKGSWRESKGTMRFVRRLRLGELAS